MNGYAKLFSSIVFSTVWRGTTKDTKILWVAMLALADADGMVEASLPGLAAASDLTIDETKDALVVLMAPDEHSKNPANEGRRVEKRDGGFFILNYRTHRDKLTVAHRRATTRERVQRHREKKAREAVATEPAQPGPTDHDGSPTETVIPLDLSTRAEAILPELLSAMKGVTLDQLRDGVREFVSYWTIGGGKFKRRNFWMKRLREDLRQKYEKGKFRPPGAIEHDDRAPKQVPLSDGAAKLIAMAKEEDEKRRKNGSHGTRRTA